MKFGIYFAYWEKEWNADYEHYIKKAAELGFDIMELSCAPMDSYTDAYMQRLRDTAANYGVTLTAGYGPTPERNLSSADPAVAKNAKAYFNDLMRRLQKMGITSVGGGLNSYWPVDYSKPVDKARDWETGVKNVREVARTAADCGIDFCIECLNRFEGYLTNTAAEGVRFCEEVGLPNVKLLLDTFHMNIEEDSFYEAIVTAGNRLARLHTGEPNRRVPGKGRTPWFEIGSALHAIHFDGDVVMEPFVLQGGTVGSDIKVWRDLSEGADSEKLDQDARDALAFSRIVLGRQKGI